MPDETSALDPERLDPQRAANLAENPYAGQGSVMLDIGDDVGAIVLHLPASLEGAEVEIEPGDGTAAPAPAHGHPDAHDHPHTHDHDDEPHTHDHGHDHPHRPHVAVVGRPVGERVDYSAVFPDLTEGAYALFVPGAAAPLRLEVCGGEVTDATWPPDPQPV